jgi:hypothetical protein
MLSVKELVSDVIKNSAYNWVRPSLWTAVFGSKEEKNAKKSGKRNVKAIAAGAHGAAAAAY